MYDREPWEPSAGRGRTGYFIHLLWSKSGFPVNAPLTQYVFTDYEQAVASAKKWYGEHGWKINETTIYGSYD